MAWPGAHGLGPKPGFNAPFLRQAPDGRGGGEVGRSGPPKPVRDGYDPTPGVQTGAKASSAPGPYGSLAAFADFSGSVKTASGRIALSVRLAPQDAAQTRPLVFLDGLATRADRAFPLGERFRNLSNRSVITILLKGQGETLANDLKDTGGKSLSNDITDVEQAKVVVDTLDALGVRKPVDVLGLSYGGAIAAAVAREAPDRVENTLLVAPHVRSQARIQYGEAAWQMMNHPFNLWGQQTYRSAAKALLSNAYAPPKSLEAHPSAFGEALFRLSMGIDRNELEDSTQGLDNIHALVAEGDGASPPRFNEQAVNAAKSGSFTLSPEHLKGKHDLLSADPDHVIEWFSSVVDPKSLPQVRERIAAAQQAEKALAP